MEAIRKQASKLREQVAKQQQVRLAVLFSIIFLFLGHSCPSCWFGNWVEYEMSNFDYSLPDWV